MPLRSLPFFVLLAVMITTPSFACTCGSEGLSPRDQAEEEFERADAVFEGEIVGVRVAEPLDSNTLRSITEITFRVEHAYKGELAATVTVVSKVEGTTCELGPTPGQHLFVYAFQSKRGLLVEPCTRTTLSVYAAADRRYASGGPATPEDLLPVQETERIGAAPELRTAGASVAGIVDGIPQGSAKIYLVYVDESGNVSGRIAAIARIHSDGRFELRYLHPGRYRAYVLSSPKSEAGGSQNRRYVGLSEVVQLVPGKRVIDLRIALRAEALGAIRVVVRGPRPEALMALAEEIEDEKHLPRTDPFRGGRASETVDREGSAFFEGLPFGTYMVGPAVTSEEDDREWQDEGHSVRVEISEEHPVADVELSISRRH